MHEVDDSQLEKLCAKLGLSKVGLKGSEGCVGSGRIGKCCNQRALASAQTTGERGAWLSLALAIERFSRQQGLRVVVLGGTQLGLLQAWRASSTEGSWGQLVSSCMCRRKGNAGCLAVMASSLGRGLHGLQCEQGYRRHLAGLVAPAACHAWLMFCSHPDNMLLTSCR
jgi:hypothetical protein